MKKIYLIAFRGTGFRDEKFVGEDTLIRAGHVGFSFEGDETSIRLSSDAESSRRRWW